VSRSGRTTRGGVCGRKQRRALEQDAQGAAVGAGSIASTAANPGSSPVWPAGAD
jgi:hypothetical protein